MKPIYNLKHASVFLGAIAMLFGSASLAQAETLTAKESRQLEESAIATNVSFKAANHQIKQSVSTRATDLLPTDDPKVAEPTATLSNSSVSSVATSPASQYSLTPMVSTERAAVAAPSNESVFADTDGNVTASDVTASDVTADQTRYLSQAEDTYEADPDEDVFDGEDGGLFEDEDVDDGDGDDFLEDAAETISPGRATRSGPSYIGIGGNIGLGDGDTALGEGSFAAFSKIGLTRNISVRPSILINDNPTILLPVTFDFIPGVTEVTENISEDIGYRVSPFIGAGAAISTGDDGSVDFLATGGVDVPLGNNFTGVAAVNVSLFDDPAIGLLLGVGVNFPALR